MVNYDTLTFPDIIDYWLKLYPELDSKNELINILNKISHLDIDLLQTQYNESLSVNLRNKDILYKIEKIFSVKSEVLNDIYFEKVKKDTLFLNFIIPILKYYIEKYSKNFINNKFIRNNTLFFKNITINLLPSLVNMYCRTLILEINVAKNSKKLLGNTPEERFDYFNNILLKNKCFLKQLYLEYWPLIELICNRVENYFTYIDDIIKQTKEQLKLLSIKLNNGYDLGKIDNIYLELGDLHKKNKSVAIICFDSNFKIVYKPRNMLIERAFEKFITWINKNINNDILELRTAKVHCGDYDYGWMEYIEYKECNSITQIKNYYYRSGELLAVLHMLNAKDFHNENIIAHGEDCIPIDLESLFHEKLKIDDKDSNGFLLKNDVLDEAIHIMDKSVMSVGFLPCKIINKVGNGFRSIDVSGLGGEKVQMSPFNTYRLKEKNTDNIRIEKDNGYLDIKENNPKYNGIIQESQFFVDDIKNGFSAMYKWINDNKLTLIKVCISIFSGKKCRYILRPTYRYSQLLRTSYHPDFLRKNIERKILLHRIAINKQVPINVVRSEIKDLIRGDIPIFNIYTNSTIILDSEGKNVMDISDKTPLDKVINKIKQFSYEELDKQISFIDSSFKSKVDDGSKDVTNIKFLKNITKKTSNDKWIKTAREIGDYILENSIEKMNNKSTGRTWISATFDSIDKTSWGIGPVGTDLYSGNSGIALFLGYLGLVLNDKKFIQAAIETSSIVIKGIENLNKKIPYLIGGYNGLSGDFYLISKIASITKDKKYEEVIDDNIDSIGKLVDKDNMFDVIGGSAGCLGVLISIYNNTDNNTIKNKVLDIAKMCSEHLIKKYRKVTEKFNCMGV
jgi:type 2 lantibiotic biosynthesis protein LanM